MPRPVFALVSSLASRRSGRSIRGSSLRLSGEEAALPSLLSRRPKEVCPRMSKDTLTVRESCPSPMIWVSPSEPRVHLYQARKPLAVVVKVVYCPESLGIQRCLVLVSSTSPSEGPVIPLSWLPCRPKSMIRCSQPPSSTFCNGRNPWRSGLGVCASPWARAAARKEPLPRPGKPPGLNVTPK